MFMVLIVDDLLAIPGKIGSIILKTIYQTAYKTAWINYQRELNNMLIRAKHERQTGKIAEEKYKEMEEYVFKEMRIARMAMSKAGG